MTTLTKEEQKQLEEEKTRTKIKISQLTFKIINKIKHDFNEDVYLVDDFKVFIDVTKVLNMNRKSIDDAVIDKFEMVFKGLKEEFVVTANVRALLTDEDIQFKSTELDDFGVHKVMLG